MYARSGSALTRIIITALLLLAVSPVTAPFVTLDLNAPRGDSTTPSVALVQPKTTHDEPIPMVVPSAAFLMLGSLDAPAAAPLRPRESLGIAFLPPLRI
jgi:hypothetical protein